MSFSTALLSRIAPFMALALPLAAGDTLQVRVSLATQAPEAPVVVVDRNPEHCGASLEDPVLLVGPKGGVQNAVVWIECAVTPEGSADELEDAKVTGEKCLMHPRVQAVRVGTRVKLGNADGTVSHDFHGWLGDRTKFRLTLLNSSYEFRRTLRDAGIYRVDCDTHKWMKAYIAVFPHPYYGVTGDSGEAQIPDLPPGEYTLKIWHEVLGEHSRRIHIRAGAPNAASHEFELEDQRPSDLKPVTVEPWPPAGD